MKTVKITELGGQSGNDERITESELCRVVEALTTDVG